MSNRFMAFTCQEVDELEVWRWVEDQDDDLLDRKPSR
jgi:hypothetical protein